MRTLNEAFIANQFKKGQSGNPKGRNARKGRQAMLETMEVWFYENRDKFMKRLGQEAYKKPIAFARDILIPLFPKEMLLEMKDADGKTAVWRCITDMCATPDDASVMAQAMQAKPAIDVDSKEVPDAGSP